MMAFILKQENVRVPPSTADFHATAKECFPNNRESNCEPGTEAIHTGSPGVWRS